MVNSRNDYARRCESNSKISVIWNLNGERMNPLHTRRINFIALFVTIGKMGRTRPRGISTNYGTPVQGTHVIADVTGLRSSVGVGIY